MKKRILYFIMILNLVGCYGGFPEIRTVGIIEGYINDTITGNVVSRVLVKVEDFEYITDENGYFPLVKENTEAPYIIPNEGGNSYLLKRDDYFQKNGNIRFFYGQKNLIGYITPASNMEKSSILTLTVMDSENVLSGANVIINGTFDSQYEGINSIPIVEETLEDGTISKKIPNGWTNIYIYKEGYLPAYINLNLSKDTLRNLELKKSANIKYGEIKGSVTGFRSDETATKQGDPGRGAIIRCGGQWSMAKEDGSFHLVGVPVGEQIISARMPGFYERYSDSVMITENETTIKNIDMETIINQ